MNKISVVIVEDEWIVSEEIKELLIANGFQVLGQAASASEAILLIQSSPPDIALLDINIQGDMDGIELAKLIKTSHIGIIFLTAFDDSQYLDRASKANPSAYLVKPFDPRNLMAAIRLAFSKMAGEKEITDEESFFLDDRIFIREGGRFNKLMLTEISFIEAVGSYTDIHTQSKKITLAINLKTFMEKLRHPKFIRIHRSYVVNIDHVTSFEAREVEIKGKFIPLSGTYKEEFLKALRTI